MINWNDPKHLLAAVAVVAVVIVGLYYVMSPYQNCMGGFKKPMHAWCIGKTSW
jgi:hypothetical protein